MSFELQFTPTAEETYSHLKRAAEKAFDSRKTSKKSKASKQVGLFKQVFKTLEFLSNDPRHPSLQTHAYDEIPHPFDEKQKVFEAYVQNKTPGAYRVFWCYGPQKSCISIIAITPHP